MSLRTRALAEFFGSAFLLMAVCGSGIMAERLAGGNAALALLANALATGGALFALISALGPISGAHFNPLVTLALAPRRDWAAYVAAQLSGAVVGILLAHAMFELPLLQVSTHARSGWAQGLSEGIATFGLIALILLLVRARSTAVPAAVAAYIVGAYWFTASTSFANPAVTLARALTDTFCGIAPQDVPGFLLSQALGAALAWRCVALLPPTASSESP